MKFPPLYSAWCAAILLAFGVAAFQGYALSSLFSGVDRASKTASHYHK